MTVFTTVPNGNIFSIDAEAYVNPVNCVGVMGAGLALNFRRAFPPMFRAYSEICRGGVLKPGEVLLYHRREARMNPHYILNVATKYHWKEQSKIEYIESIATTLARVLQNNSINSVAIPAIGCGLGGLDWNDVHQILLDAINNIEGLYVVFIPPR